MSGSTSGPAPIVEDTRVPPETQEQLRQYWMAYGPNAGMIIYPTLWDDGITAWDDNNTTFFPANGSSLGTVIDQTKPAQGTPDPADIRSNFHALAAGITALQSAMVAPQATGQFTLGIPPVAIVFSVGVGAPNAATPGAQMKGSRYTDTQAQQAILSSYISAGNGTWLQLS